MEEKELGRENYKWCTEEYEVREVKEGEKGGKIGEGRLITGGRGGVR